ncbi:MAG: aspartate--tRNA ligase, partial [Candidatus Nanopelagicales bacterium]
MIRSREAGTLRSRDEGERVTLAGWVAHRRDHGGVAFLDLRDASGVAQVVVRDPEVAGELRSEFCIKVSGAVALRPAGNENRELASGEVEVIAEDVEVLSPSEALPFPLDEHLTVGEDARLRHRYLDLRREEPGRLIRLRARTTKVIRDVMDRHDFLEIETPNLTRSTPEGARDFLVPVRLQPGSWYALPQSPQLFKQLLMVAGMERYYQIARCFRDEDFRADRQPEFTQLDIEMSFADQDDVLQVAEDVVAAVWLDIHNYQIPLPLPRMTFDESMRRFGSDKPDIRFDNELVDLTSYFADTSFRVFQRQGDDWHVGAVVMPGGAKQSRKELDGWQDWAKARGARGLAYVLVQDDGSLGGPVAKNLSESERVELASAAGAAVGDAVFFAAGLRRDALTLLGAARSEIGTRCALIDESRWAFLWIVDAPMFEPAGDGGWTPVHHPFTSPRQEWMSTFDAEPGKALAYAYDMVLNGSEIGGGSLRIHRADVQRRVFDVIGLSETEAESKFGFLLEAFKYGPPPHGGIAFGL